MRARKNFVAIRKASRRWLACVGLATAMSLATLLICAAPALAQGPIYVTPTGAGSGDGSSWGNAAMLQAALSTATSGDEIWVATGVYTPGVNAAATFTVTSGVQLYGGFAATETLRTQRNWLANPTVLSGDLGGDDTTDASGVVTTTANIAGANAYHVFWLDGVNGAPITQTTRIDGFTVTAGQANGSYPHNYGGGLYCAGNSSGKACSPTIANLNFSGNTASRGGAMADFGSTSGVSSPSLINVTFSGNSATVSGGAMYNYGAGGVSSPNLVNVTFSGNSAGNTGGAMYNYGGGGGVSSPNLVNVAFSNNAATFGAGAMHNYGNSGVSSPSLLNVTFVGNAVTGGGGGGAMNNDGNSGGICRPSLVNVVLWGNTATNGGQLYNVNAAPIISYTLTPSTAAAIYNASSTITWGMGNITDTATFTTADIFVDAANGDLRLAAFSPAIDAGDNTVVPVGVTTDLVGNPRFYDDRVMRDRGSGSPPLVDMGASERQTDSCLSAAPIYVDAGVTGGRNNGSSWTNAYTYLQDGLTAARLCPGMGEVWVATGIYTPGVTTGATFTVTSGIQLYGGFAATETLRTQRDWVANPTVLSGDIDGNDATAGGVITHTEGIAGANAKTVVVMDGTSGIPITGTTQMDGFTVTGGSGGTTFGYGGGVYCNGAGVGSECSPTIANVVFSGNSASYGGAMYNDGRQGASSPSLLNVVFQGNAAPAGNGGALYNNGYQGVSSPSLTNVVFAYNRATVRAGALYNSADGGVSSPSLVNVSFSGNSANFGGAMFNGSWNGGASHPILVNVIMFDNSANFNGGDIYNVGSSPAISYTLVPSSTATIYGDGITWGPGNITDTAAFTTADIFVDAANGNLRLASGSPAIDVGDNSAIPAGVTTDLGSAPRIVNGAVDLGAYERQEAHLGLAKSVSPDGNVAYRGIITYTVVLSNTGTADPAVLLTDTLPIAANFAYWIAQSGAAFADNTVQWSGALDTGAVMTIAFAVTNTASGGVAITNTAYLSGSASILASTAVYTVTANSYPAGSGNWSEVFGECAAGCKRVIPAGVTVTLDQDISLDGDFEIEPGATFIANGKTVTLTGDQAQTLTGNPLTFYSLMVNKSNKTDTVTIDGKLKVSKKLTVRKGKLVSASDYEDVEIEADGELQLTSDITVSGHFTNSGTFNSNGFGVTFDGARGQNLVLNTFTGFDFLTVYTGTTLIETVTDDNAFIYDTLTNYGVIRKMQPIASPLDPNPDNNLYYFGLAGIYPNSTGLEIGLTNLSGDDPLTTLQVDRIDANHPNAPGGATTDIYWSITPSGTNYVATLVLPQNALTSPAACRYSGSLWECNRISFDSVTDLTVTRAGVTAFSDWAVFETAATTTALATSANPVEVDTLITVTATVEPLDVPGSIAFFADGASLGSAPVTAGSAQTSTTGLAVGTHVITATYTPTGPFLPSSGALTPDQEVTCASTRTVVNTNDSGAGSLRQAIADVCAGGVVDFAPVLTAGGATTITLTSGQALTLTRDVTIVGPGTGLLAVSGNNATRVFVVSSGVSATIDGLTVRNGRSISTVGGGIYNAGTLTLTNSAVTSSFSLPGGGGIYNAGVLTVISSTLSGSTSNSMGGGIYNVATLTMIGSTLSGNVCYGMGGGVYNAATLTVISSTLTGNASNATGGGIYNIGTLTMSGSALLSNSSFTSGGGIGNSSFATLVVIDSMIANNQATAYGGGVSNDGGLTLLKSTIANNSASSGGGVSNSGALTATTSVFANNRANIIGGGLLSSRAATVENSTFFSNTAGITGGVHNDQALTLTNSTIAGAAGGVGLFNAGTLYMRNSLIAISTGTGHCTNTGTIAENSNNLIADGSCSASLSGDPLLGALDDYGGDTQTVPLLPGSPAIDAGDVATCLATDQRGIARPQGSSCDIGAFESRGFGLTLAGGDNQQTVVGTGFSTPLVVIVTSSYSEPVDGGQIVYTGPASDAGVEPMVYTGTVSGGLASQGLTANLIIGGPYTVTANTRGATPAIDFTLSNTCGAVMTVTNNADSGGGSLRWSVANTCDGGVVRFDAALENQTIALTTGQIEITRTLTIDGPGADKLAVSGNSASRIFAIGAGISVTIDGLTLREGYTNEDDGGGAIYAAGSLTITGSSLVSNTVASAGAGDRGGGAVSLAGANLYTLVVSDTSFVSNTAFYAGGALYVGNGTLDLDNSSLVGNTASGDQELGGAIYCDNCTFTIDGADFSDNHAKRGGALYITESNFGGQSAITSSDFQANQAAPTDNGWGGAIFVDNYFQITISDTAVLSNAAAAGGGLYIKTTDANLGISLMESTLAGNTAEGNGGGIVNAGRLTVNGSIFTANAAATTGGALDNAGWLAIVASSFVANTAEDGGAINIAAESPNAAISSAHFAGNQSQCDGGAIYNTGALYLGSSEFFANQASVDCQEISTGGAIFTQGALQVAGSAFHDNHANAGGVVGITGNLALSSTVVIRGSALYSNSASLFAGAVLVAGPSTLHVEQSSIYSNSAQYVGGVGSAYGGALLDIVNTTFAGNVAQYTASALFAADYDVLTNGQGFGPDTVSLQNVTIADNRLDGTPAPGAFFAIVGLDGGYGGPTVAITNTIVAAGNGEQACLFGAPATPVAPPALASLDNDGTCGGNFRQSDAILLGPLGDYGQPIGDAEVGAGASFTLSVPVFPLLPGSAAINAGASSQTASSTPVNVCPYTDQRRVSRPQGNGCDIGAFESQGFTLVKTGGDNQSTPWGSPFTNPLAMSVNSSHDEPVNGGIVTFAGPNSGASVVPVTQTATVASGAVSVTVAANGVGGAYSIAVTANGAQPVAFSLTNLLRATQTSVQSSLNPAQYSQAVTLTASVAVSGITAAGQITGPTGHVRFSDETGELATVTLVDGVAVYTRDTWATGVHTVTAVYLGDGNYSGSTADPLVQIVGQHGTATLLISAPNPTKVGDTFVMTATVEKQVAAQIAAPPAGPTGQVQFYSGATLLDTVVLSGGVAMLERSDFAAGVYTLTAVYGGDTNCAGSTSDAVQQVVRPLPVAINDAAGVLQGEAVQIDPLANDRDPAGGGLTVTVVGQAEHGAAVVEADAKTLTYTPDPAFSGVDSFLYTAQDVNGNRDEALVAVVVTARSETGAAPQIGVIDNETASNLTFPDGGAQVDVVLPPGSFSGTLGERDVFYLAYTSVMTPTGDTGQQPGGLRFGNLVFDLSAYLNGGQLAGYVFPQPVTVVITYNPALIFGLDEATLALHYWNGTAWASDGITFVSRNLDTHTLTMTLAHLSEFALFAAPSTPTGLDPEPEPTVTSYLYLPAVMSAATGFTAPTVHTTPEGNPLTAAGGLVGNASVKPDAASPSEPTPDTAAAASAPDISLHLPLVIR